VTQNACVTRIGVWRTQFSRQCSWRVAEDLDTIVSALGCPGELEVDPELLRFKGELLISRDPGARAGAEIAFSQAIDIAQQQNSKSWELRAAHEHGAALARSGEES
jgi:hypothetical protein